jgi:hypothetical protein
MFKNVFAASGLSSCDDVDMIGNDVNLLQNSPSVVVSSTKASSVMDCAEKSFDTSMTQDIMSDSSVQSSDPTVGVATFTDTGHPNHLVNEHIAAQGPSSDVEIADAGSNSQNSSNVNLFNSGSSVGERDENARTLVTDEEGQIRLIKVGKGGTEKEGQLDIARSNDVHDQDIQELLPSLEVKEQLLTTVRREFKPHPTTLEEKRQAKEDAVSRLNRIKAKAVKSATKSLGVDESNLSYAVGLSSDTLQSKRPNKIDVSASNMDDPDHVQFIADALGLPIEMFGVKPVAPKHQALDMSAADTSASGQIYGMQEEDSSATTSGRTVLPHAGSLAAALGMVVDKSENAAPVRHVTVERISLGPHAPGRSVMSLSPGKGQDHLATTTTPSGFDHASSGQQVEKASVVSFAQDLGIPVSYSTTVTQDLSKVVTSSPLGVASAVSSKSGSAKPGSLASVLGMSIDYSDNAPPVQFINSTQVPIELPTALSRVGHGLDEPSTALGTPFEIGAPICIPAQVSRPQKGSLAAALGVKVEPFAPSHSEQKVALGGSNESDEDLYATTTQPEPGSLAAALGLEVSPGYDPTKLRREPQDQSLLEEVFSNAIANEKKSSVSNSLSLKSHETTAPKKGSLAEALGICVAESNNMPLPKDVPQVPCPGSLAAALGMTILNEAPFCDRHLPVGPTSRSFDAAFGVAASARDKVGVKTHKQGVISASSVAPLPGTLAAALGLGASNGLCVSNDHEIPRLPKSNVHSGKSQLAVPGSLAAALGIPVCSENERNVGEKPSQEQDSTRPVAGSLAAALGMGFCEEQQMPTSRKRQGNADHFKIPVTGSLADALGIYVSESQGLPAPEKSHASLGRSVPPAAGSLAAALGLMVSHEPAARASQQTQRDSVQLRAPATEFFAADPAMTVHDDEKIDSMDDSQAGSKPMDKTAVAGSLVGFTSVSVRASRKCFRPVREAPAAGSLAAALGMAVCAQETSVSTRTSCTQSKPVREGPVAGSLAAALGMATSQQETSVSVQNSRIGSEPAREEPNAGSLAAALGIAVSKQETSVSVTRSPTKYEQVSNVPVPGSLAAALGMAVSEQEPSVSLTRVPSRYKSTSDGRPAGELTSSVRSVEDVPSPSFVVAPNSDAEIRLVVELAAARAATTAAKAYGRSLELEMAQMSKLYSSKLAELQGQIVSFTAEIEQKSRALEVAEMHQQRSLVMDDQEEEMFQAQEGLIRRLCRAAERMTRTRNLMEEADSMLQSEINEIRAIKEEYDQGDSGDGSSTSGSSTSCRSVESLSGPSGDLRMKLQREDERRKSIKARLREMQEAHR